MGLDVTAYKGLTKLDCVFDADGEPIDPATREPIDEYFRSHGTNEFPGRDEGIESGAVYRYDESLAGPSLGYGGYNRWREELARLAGYEPTPHTRWGQTEMLHAAACWSGATGPFAELINFTDCDGVIGPVVAARLLTDFKAFDERAQAIGEAFYAVYREFTECFEMAAQDGAVSFH